MHARSLSLSLSLHPFICSCVSGLVQLLTAEQKQQSVNICEELCQTTSDDATILSKVITGDESWIYSYDPETKQQSSQWKMKNKVKSMLIIFLGIKGIVHKKFIFAGQTLNSAYYCDVLWRLYKNVQRLLPKLW
jgi:histone-lysine N-methyltransferase SETMAR